MPGSTLSVETDFFKNLPPIRDMGEYVNLPGTEEVAGGVNNNVESQAAAGSENSQSEPSGGSVSAGNTEGLSASRPDESTPGTGEHTGETVAEQRGQSDGLDVPKLSVEEFDALKAQVEQWEGLSQSYAQNPVEFIKALVGNLTPAQQQVALAQFAPQPQPAQAPQAPQVAFRPDSELTPEELFVKHQVSPMLQQVQQQAAQVPQVLQQFQQQVAQAIQVRDGYISEMALQNAVLQAQLEALTASAEITLPAVDRAAIDRLVRSGKTYQEAVDATYKPKAITTAKTATAAKKPTPQTPMNGAGEAPEPDLPANASMFDIFKQAERELAQSKRR